MHLYGMQQFWNMWLLMTPTVPSILLETQLQTEDMELLSNTEALTEMYFHKGKVCGRRFTLFSLWRKVLYLYICDI